MWNVATKSLVSTEGATGTLTRWRRSRRPAYPQRSYDNTIRVWLLDGTLKNTFQLHTGVAFVALPDNQHALSGSADKTVTLFNVNDGAVLRTFTHTTTRLSWRYCRTACLRQRLGDRTARIACSSRAVSVYV